MKSKENCKTAKTFGIVSIITAILLPFVGIILAIIGLNVTREEGKEDRDLILNWIGIGIALVNMLITIVLFA